MAESKRGRGRPRKEPEESPAIIRGPFADVPAARPPKPATIVEDGVASDEWDRVCDLLTASLTAADAGVLTAYCSTYAILVHARRQLHPSSQSALDYDGRSGKKPGGRPDPRAGWDLLTETAAGGSKVHGLVALIRSAGKDLVVLSEALGMTPAARARATAGASSDEDDFDEWVAANRR